MNFLKDNPIANLQGPTFLAFFAIVIVILCGWTWWRVRSADRTRGMPLPTLPAKLNPFEIAHLRGGWEEQVRLIILDLVARGYLVHSTRETKTKRTESTIEHAPKIPDVAHLDPLARYVFDWIDNPKSAAEIFPGLPNALRKRKTVEGYDAALEARGLLVPEEQQKSVLKYCVPAQWIIFLLGAYKLYIALSRGRHNVLFLILLTVGGLFLVQSFCRARRLTALGRRYLARVQQALDGLKPRLSALASTSGNDHFILAVAAFGIGTLASTSYAYYPTMFEKGARFDTGGCASTAGCGLSAPANSFSGSSGCSSSSSCSSGSSCGSSCGGGCGGGCGGCGS